MITLCVDKAYWLWKKPFCRPTTTGNEITVLLFFYFHWNTARCCLSCLWVIWKVVYIVGRQSPVRFDLLMLMSEWKCLHSFIYKLHLPCLHLIVRYGIVSLGNASDQTEIETERERESKLLSHFFFLFSFLSLFLKHFSCLV